MASATASSGRDGVRRLLAALAVGAALLGSQRPARADVAADKATAEALFNHARALMKEGNFADACPKLAESQRLDAGLGTMLYLADCYEKTGQTASAWTEFLDAAAVAHATAQPEREQKARERAAALEPKLNRLSISLASGAEVPGIEVRGDGRPLDRALWGRPIPIDPGEHSVSASAPGKQPWSKKVQVSAADTATVFAVVPVLVDEAPRAVAPPPVTPPPVTTGAPSTPSSSPPRRIEPPPPLPPDTNLHVRRLGYTMIGLGLAGAAVGGVFGAVAMLDNANASPTCRINNVCTAGAASSRTDAYNLARVSTIVLSSGAGVFAAGVVIAIVTRAPEPGEGSAPRALLHLTPMVGAGLGGVAAGGAF